MYVIRSYIKPSIWRIHPTVNQSEMFDAKLHSSKHCQWGNSLSPSVITNVSLFHAGYKTNLLSQSYLYHLLYSRHQFSLRTFIYRTACKPTVSSVYPCSLWYINWSPPLTSIYCSDWLKTFFGDCQKIQIPCQSFGEPLVLFACLHDCAALKETFPFSGSQQKEDIALHRIKIKMANLAVLKNIYPDFMEFPLKEFS